MAVLQTLVSQIGAKNPLHRKRLVATLKSHDTVYWQRADDFTRRLTRYLESNGLGLEMAVESYLKMCKEMLAEQTRFQATGCYSCPNQEQAFSDTYSHPETMRSYMVGLAVSQFLWTNHYAIYDYYLQTLDSLTGTAATYLEIGPGHGLYLAAALNQLGAQHYRAIDISPISLELCRGLLPFFCDGSTEPTLEQRNALDIEDHVEVDFVTMGEVIEHLDDPRPVLRRIAAMLSPSGRAFLTTCANCPARDHVYLFRNEGEIRSLLNECGLEVVTERVLPLEEPGARPDSPRLINYAALVRSVAS